MPGEVACIYLMSTFPLCPTLYTFEEPLAHITFATDLPDSLSQPRISLTRPDFPKRYKIVLFFIVYITCIEEKTKVHSINPSLDK